MLYFLVELESLEINPNNHTMSQFSLNYHLNFEKLTHQSLEAEAAVYSVSISPNEIRTKNGSLYL